MRLCIGHRLHIRVGGVFFYGRTGADGISLLWHSNTNRYGRNGRITSFFRFGQCSQIKNCTSGENKCLS